MSGTVFRCWLVGLLLGLIVILTITGLIRMSPAVAFLIGLFVGATFSVGGVVVGHYLEDREYRKRLR
jgi:hypothetical protein